MCSWTIRGGHISRGKVLDKRCGGQVGKVLGQLYGGGHISEGGRGGGFGT